MKAITSTTLDDKYLFFLPIISWCWNKLNVDVICFLPSTNDKLNTVKYLTVLECMRKQAMSYHGYMFDAPEHKQATYAQCSRLFAGSLDLSEDRILLTTDVDMIVFNGDYFKEKKGAFDVYGADLVPIKQLPICYISATKKDWNDIFNQGRDYQQCLDDLLGGIEVENMRGNYWSKDQNEAYDKIIPTNTFYFHNRTNGQNQFATKRYDRDDAYLLDRLNPDTIDYHLPRPLWEENNFNQMLTVLNYHYPDCDLTWMREYRDQYVKLM